MKISFLVTFYNQKEYVKRCLDSVISVDKPGDWELLVGDDGSTDGTVEEVKKYIKKYPNRIKLYCMPRDLNIKYDSVKRASANRLNLLKKSSGDYFGILDGDDYYCDTEFARRAIDIFNIREDVTVVAFRYKRVVDGVFAKKNIQLSRFPNGVVKKEKYLKHFYVHGGACIYRKCFKKERIEYLENLGYFDDNDIVINNLNYGEMYSIDRVVYAYTQNTSSVYSTMNSMQQAILNVQGLDVDTKLISQNYRNVLLYRYAKPLIYLLIWKKKIKKYISDEEYERTLESCLSIKPSICYDILTNPETLDPSLKKEVKFLFYKKFHYAIYQMFRCVKS